MSNMKPLTTSLCVQLSTYADNVALPAFTCNMLLLQQLKDISCQLGQQQQSCSSRFAAVGMG